MVVTCIRFPLMLLTHIVLVALQERQPGSALSDPEGCYIFLGFQQIQRGKVNQCWAYGCLFFWMKSVKRALLMSTSSACRQLGRTDTCRPFSSLREHPKNWLYTWESLWSPFYRTGLGADQSICTRYWSILRGENGIRETDIAQLQAKWHRADARATSFPAKAEVLYQQGARIVPVWAGKAGWLHKKRLDHEQ